MNWFGFMVVRSFCDTWSSKALERYDGMTMAWSDVFLSHYFQTDSRHGSCMIDAEKWLQKWLSYVAVIFHNLFHLCLELKLTTSHNTAPAVVSKTEKNMGSSTPFHQSSTSTNVWPAQAGKMPSAQSVTPSIRQWGKLVAPPICRYSPWLSLTILD